LIVVERDQAQPPRCFHICPSDSAEPLLAESLTTATQWQPRVLAALVGIAFASEAAWEAGRHPRGVPVARGADLSASARHDVADRL